MTENRICRTDLHLHTNYSFCAPKDTYIESYLPHCAAEGIRTIGISNHLYATEINGIKGLSYLDYILQGKAEAETLRKTTDVRILYGCESEIFWGQEAGLRPEDAHHFDYVLMAASHIFNWLPMYKNVDLSSADKVRDILLKQFCRACMVEYDIPVGICHPLYPICCPWEQEVVDGITEAQLTECFSLAAERNRSIEIHACLYRNGTQLDEDGISPSYTRLLTAAKKCGCKFHFGSDAHAPGSFTGTHAKLERAAQRSGITEADLWEVGRF